MLLLRLSPLIPYNALDYLSGTTSISFEKYSMGLIGILPGVVLYCFLGSTGSAVASGNIQWLSYTLGLFFAITGVAVASYYAREELESIIDRESSTDCLVGSPENGNEFSVPHPYQVSEIV